MRVKIGLESHVQLNTRSKIFCGCLNPVNLDDEHEPNTLTCPTCLGMPGSKPRFNGEVVGMAMKVGLALNCGIAKETFFSRKTYFYPDLAKNFQITQFEVPLARQGRIRIMVDGLSKKIGITRVHMEEDPAKLIHIGGLGGKHALVDYNRSGIPLVEIVTAPDLRSPKEARLFLQRLASILEYLGLYDPGSRAVFKTDANVSIAGGARIEIKNITGTKEIEQALKYEIVRQANMLKRGIRAKKETRAWNPVTGSTQSLRGKEGEEEYGYIFEPDLTRIEIGSKMVEAARKRLPELPDEKLARYVKAFGLQAKLAESLVSDPQVARFFELVSRKTDPRLAASWIAGPLKKTLNFYSVRLSQTRIKPEWVIRLLRIFREGKITDRNAELVIRKMVEEGRGPEDIISKHGFGKVGRRSEIEAVIRKVIDGNQAAVKDYRAGSEKALHFLVGQVMRESRGKIDPKEARKLLERELHRKEQ
jgi:aspartyl-tRNA(Asn)/glutamyl-tRNA(Gln) amidotransferase subunit B